MSNVSPANQHTNDEREQKCWDLYLLSVAAGQPNAMQSAISAGYSEDHSRNITMQGWFKDRLDGLRRKGMKSKAERNLDKMLDTEWDKDEKIQPEIMRIVADVSKTVATRLGKDDGWSERTEHTGADGKDLQVTVMNYADKSSGDVSN